MEVTVENCNNLDKGTIDISDFKLNIKFGINGTGKSTIAKAIKFQLESNSKLSSLKPFKLQDSDSKLEPVVVIPANINSVLVFDEEYLSQFLFKDDELIANSFDIFIKTPEYIEFTENIEKILGDIKNKFSENIELEQMIRDFENLSGSFKVTKGGAVSKTSSGYKSFKDGNLIENIPKHLEGYRPFLNSDEPAVWIDWQSKGKKFLDISDKCPYCTSPSEDKKV